MTFQKKAIILIVLVVILLPVGYIIWNESFYFDRVPFLSPINYSGQIPIRNDWRGKGDFGTKRNGNKRHQGIDILASIGTPVRAAKGGKAIAGFHRKGHGKYVEIIHKNDIITIYSHLSKIYIRPVQMVRQGQIISEVGKTGNARYKGVQSHLHFEIRKRGVVVDPKNYICK